MRISDWSSDVCSSDLPAAWRAVIEQGMALDPGARFPTIESWRSAVHDVLSGEVAATPIARHEDAAGNPARCPYKGLASYQPEDAGSFFGREARSEEHTSELQSLMRSSYAVFCLKK